MPDLWTTYGGNYLARFSTAETEELRRLARLRYEPKRKAGVVDRLIDTSRDRIENDLLGLKGEAAVAEFLKVAITSDDRLCGDGGVSDLEKDGVTIQVKTSWHPSGRLLYKDIRDCMADVSVLVVTVANDDRLRIAGWISREQFHSICDRGFNGRAESAHVHQAWLYPMSRLGLYIQNKKEENEAHRIEFEERAAIMEFDGGLTRTEAEKAAKADILTHRR